LSKSRDELIVIREHEIDIMFKGLRVFQTIAKIQTSDIQQNNITVLNQPYNQVISILK
jgi:hypothetical protein